MCALREDMMKAPADKRKVSRASVGGYKGDYQGLHHHQTLDDNGCSEKYTCEIRDDSSLVDRPTQLICISDIYLSTDKYKRHSRAIC